jgi:DNA-binding response OmpR family regulator
VPRIMIVDDDTDFQEFLGMFLELEGYEVCSAYDGASAVEQIEKQPPDLILLDVLMPEMDGFDVCLNLLSRGGKLPPVIFVSALADDTYVRRGLAIGAVHYITKPLEIVELLQTIKETVGSTKEQS